ncbi:MAG: glycosyltransferase, partial [Candidatus Vogelbacteria bacterium]|nr:glycosyltransferase [Candidatus Vogelbacteria bacterium]
MSPAKSKLFYLITKGSPFGGAQSYVLDLASSLPKDRFEPAVIMGEGGELEKKLRAENIVSYQLPSLGRDIGWQSDWKAFWALVKFLKKERPDIIHLNSSKAGFLGALAARLAHVPKIIFTAHNWAFNENRPWWQKASFRFAHWLTIILCHEVITVSEKTGSQVANWPGIKGKIHLIHNGLRPIDFLSRSEARAELAKKIWKKGFDPEILDR